MPGAVVVSVGGTRPPIVKVLQEERPDFVCFLASHHSVDEIGAIKAEVGITLTDEKVIVEDPQDLNACYQKALDCLARVERHGVSLADTIVDYTGGTKPMAAALAMAAVSQGVRFSYVGGGERDKGGLGIVKTGTEQRFVAESPWRLFAVEEKRRIAQHFNTHQYEAAVLTLTELLRRLDPGDRAILEPIRMAAEAFAAWDRFEHAQALDRLRPVPSGLATVCSAARETAYDALVADLQTALDILTFMAGRTRKFTAKHPVLVGDLVANAERRMTEGKFDDAVARLYRALELLGQCAFEEHFGMETGKADAARLPSSLQDEFRRRYEARDGLLKLGLEATYAALAAGGHSTGERYRAIERDLREVQSARNNSILAHGTTPVREGAARRLRDLLLTFLPPDLPAPRFPRLPWA